MAANLGGGEEGLFGYLKTETLQEKPSAFIMGLAASCCLWCWRAARTRGSTIS